MKNSKPLSGYTVIELSTYIAAPSCGLSLAYWGAEVIKIEPMVGDAFRHFGSALEIPATEDENPIWDLINAHKKSISLDLNTEDDMIIFQELLCQADIFITNLREKSLKKLGIDYDTISSKYPELIYGHVTGYGEEGPEAGRPGFDIAAYWSRNGMLRDAVVKGAEPILGPAGFGDMTVGSEFFGGICMALFNRMKTGLGDKVSISLYGASIWFSGIMITSAQKNYQNAFPKAREDVNPLILSYECSDGEWLNIALLEYDRYWETFSNALGMPSLKTDERFKSFDTMMENRGDLVGILRDVFIQRSAAEWLTVLTETDIVCERLRHFSEVTEDPQAWENGYLRVHTSRNGKKCILPNIPVKLRNALHQKSYSGPKLGHDTADVMNKISHKKKTIMI